MRGMRVLPLYQMLLLIVNRIEQLAVSGQFNELLQPKLKLQRVLRITVISGACYDELSVLP